MPLDFDVGALRLGLQRGDELIDLGFGFVRHDRFAELEVALVFAQDHFVDEPLAGLLDRLGASADRIGCRTRVTRTLVGGLRGLHAGRGLLIDLVDSPLIRARALLSLLDRLGESVDLRIDFPDVGSHELLRRAGGGSAERDGQYLEWPNPNFFIMSSV